MREKYESMPLVKLRELAKSLGMRGISAMKKGELINLLAAREEEDAAERESKNKPEPEEASPALEKRPAQKKNARAARSGNAESGNEEPQNTKPENTESAENAQQEDRALSAANGSNPGAAASAGENGQTGGTAAVFSGTPFQAGTQNTGAAQREGGRPRNVVRTPRDGGMRPRRDNNYTGGYTRNNTAPRKDASFTAEKRTGYVTADRGVENISLPERSTSPLLDRKSLFPDERREAAASAERQEGAPASDTSIDRPPMDLAQLDSGISAGGILEVMQDGYGFIRSDNYLPGDNDVYVSPSQIRRFGLKTGDIITGNTRIKSQQEKFSALLYLKTINGMVPSEAVKRYNFEDMTPIFPNERLRMERGSRAVAMRIVDLFSPIGKGQRGMIVSPPKAGKTTLLKDVARSILQNDPNMKLLILLIDERPEEVTDIKESIQGENVEVIYSTFDELPDHHKRVSEMVIERAKRLVEHKEDVTILLDSITRLARAYNLIVSPSGRTLSGGLDPAALHMPKRFFGAARKMREGGSLTILATALVDTGSKMDDVVYEEFKGTGNMELVLDRKLSEKRVFPAVDIPKSGTRRDDLLLDREEQEAVDIMRRALNGMKSDEAVENILNMFVRTRDNRELVARVRKQKFI